VLTHPEWRYVAQGADFGQSPAVQAALSGQRDTTELDDRLMGRRLLVAHVPVTGTSWGLMIVHPAAMAYSAVWGLMLRSFLILLIGMGTSAVLAFVLSRWISRPIDALGARVRQVCADSVAIRREERGRDELEQLTKAFDSLAAMLDARAAQMADMRREVDKRNLQLKNLSMKIGRIEEAERKSIAMDLHDGIGQVLATAAVEAQVAEQVLQLDVQRAQEKIHATLQLIRQACGELRRDLFGLRPPTLGRGKLLGVLNQYVSHLGTVSESRCELEIRGTPVELDEAAEVAIYRIVQECFRNAEKHARPTTIRCEMCFEPTVLRVIVRDDGAGFRFEDTTISQPGHLGIISMQERAQSIGGSIAVASTPGWGTTVTLEVPWSPRLRLAVQAGRHSKGAEGAARASGSA
jgi:signal transduction histidine kinase